MAKHCTSFVLLFCAMTWLAGAADAAYLYSWGPTPTITDATDNALAGGQDILSVWFAADASYYYFRMDVRSTPSTLGNNFSGMYGIYINAFAGGAAHGDTTYIPSGLTGIDFVLDSHFNNKGTAAFDQWDFHYNWNGAGFAVTPLAVHQETQNSGTTLEWRIDRILIGNTFSFWAATHDVGSSAPTYDLTPDVGLPGYPVVPAPASLGLLIASLACLIVRRWR